jgi:hypothetical protein
MKLDALTEVVSADVGPYILGDFTLTGSSAYRILLGLNQRDVNDVDFVIYPSTRLSDKPSLVSQDIKQKFYITILQKNPRGYRYGMVHKQTYGWADLFPRTRKPKTTIISTASGPIECETLESITWGMCVSVLERSEKNQRVLKTSLDKIDFMRPLVDPREFRKVCQENLNQTTNTVAAIIKNCRGSTVIDYVLENCLPYEPADFDLFNNQYKTPNGLCVQSE